MINTDRIVPITATDLISMYATMIKIATGGINVATANDTNGNFLINKGNMTGSKFMLNEPARSIDFTGTSGSGQIFFVPAYDYQGITKDGAAVEAGNNIVGDGRTLYCVNFNSGNITSIDQISF